jgi:hypothetical protein
MPQDRRSNTRRAIYRLAVLLIATLAIGRALALSEPKSQAPGISEKNRPVAGGIERQEAAMPPVFVPSEELSADKAVSFPTDI